MSKPMSIRVSLILSFLMEIAFSQAITSRDLFIASHAGTTVGLCQLGATYLKPTHTPPRALILFVHGSGTTNRNEQSPAGHQLFKDLAEGFSRSGFATLRFDKRGIQPECRPALINNPNLTPWHFVRDVINIITYIKKNAEFSRLPLVLLGHSEGVNFVTEIVTKTNYPFKATVLLAGLGKFPIDTTILRQYKQVLNNTNLPLKDKAKIEKVIIEGTSFFNSLHSGTAKPTDQFMSIYSKYWIDWIGITRNAAMSASKMKVPSLVIRGTADTNVTAEDFEYLKLATQHIPKSNSFSVYGLDHLFALPGQTITSPMVTAKIISWLSGI